MPLHTDLWSWLVDPSGTGDWKFQLALLPQNFQWHSPSCLMFLASIVEPGVGAFDWQNLHLRPVPIAAERLEEKYLVFSPSEERVSSASYHAL